MSAKTRQRRPSKYITDDVELLPRKVQMETGGYTLMVRYKRLKMKDGRKVDKGDTWMEGISCDSDYMMDVMPRVGKVSCCVVRLAADDAPRGHAPGSGLPIVDLRSSSSRLHSSSQGAEAPKALSSRPGPRHRDVRGNAAPRTVSGPYC